jgi:hypothetical protein
MNDQQPSAWTDAATLLSISLAAGVVRRLALGEKYTLAAFAISAAIATFVGIMVGFATRDFIQSEGLWLGVVGLSAYAAPEILVIAIIAVKKRGKTEVSKL